jgi:hypothetical protein
MVQQIINSNSVQPLGPPNFGTSVEQGDTWDAAVLKINAMFTEMYSGVIAVSAGTGAATLLPSGNIQKSVTTIGSSATNTTQTLISYSLPANTLSRVGSGIVVTAWGRKANNAAGVTFALNVGGTSINTGNVATSGGISWMFVCESYKQASNVQEQMYTGQTGTTVTAGKSTSDTSTDTSAIVITMQALDASAAQSNVLLDGFVVTYFG